MKYLLYTFSILLQFSVLADSAEYMYEFTCEYDGVNHTFYLPVDAWGEADPTSFNENKDAFPEYFKNKYAEYEEITVFTKIIDRTDLAEKAAFPMQKYHVVESSMKKLDFEKIKHIKHTKTWIKSGYGIYQVTKIFPSDIDWIDECKNQYNFGFDDVGCRLELFSAGELDENDPDVKMLYSLVENEGDYLTDQEMKAIKKYVINLKRKKVVVVQLCGC